MCAYNPGVQNRVGELLAGGIDGLTEGILANARKRKEKEDRKKMTQLFQPIIDKMAPGAGINLDKDMPKEAVPAAISLAKDFEREQREKPLRDLQTENERLRQRISQREIDEAGDNALAMQRAGRFLRPETTADFGARGGFVMREPAPQRASADPMAALSDYMSNKGTDPRVLAQLGQLAQEQMQASGKRPALTFPNEKAAMSRYPADKFDYRMIPDPATGAVAIEGLSPRAPQATMPPGYEPDPAKPGAIRPIAGSEDDTKRQDAARATRNKLDSELTRADVILTAIEQVRPKIGGFTAGLAGTALNAIPGTEAKDVSSVIDTIKANIGFEQLQRMREASPTGGALGQVAVQELKYLQAALGNLSTTQSPQRLAQTLDEIQSRYARWKKAAAGTNPDEEPGTPTPAAGKKAMTADELAAKWLKQK